MTSPSTGAAIDSGERGHRQAGRMFAARIGRFDDPADRALMDRLARWVEATYGDELKARPSKHVYLRHLPKEITAEMDRLRDGEVIRNAILEQFPDDSVVTPMQHTDELYISHYNKDFGGDHGLFTRHYDGNLRFMPVGAVVRALIYLQSDATYKVVFADSRVEKAFESYEFGLLDFHKELHWVEGDYNPEDRQRILLKCNYLIAPKNAVWVTKALLAANTGVFYVVKAAMEYSKSPRTPVQYLVGYLCNVMRLLNNIHPLVPFAVILAVIGALAWGLSRL
ncbi:MAG: hypothetical protein R3D28_26460 [Geminicoccaceae bacterium]